MHKWEPYLAWTSQEIASLRAKAFEAAKSRPEILAELNRVKLSAFWVSYRFARFDRVDLSTVKAWVDAASFGRTTPSLFSYFIDQEGELWKGPIAPLENLHFARMEGFYEPQTNRGGEPVWVLRRSAADESWQEISHIAANAIIEAPH